MNIGFVTLSASRRAGGVLGSLQPLTKHLLRLENVEAVVFAPDDDFAAADLERWQPLVPRLFPVWGPRAFGYTPGMAPALAAQDADLLHSHGLWMYYSLAVNNWGREKVKPYIVSPHGMLDPWAIANSPWKKRLAALLYENRHLKEAAALHALCEAEATSFRQYGLGNTICVIPNGIDIPETSAQYTSPPWTGLIPTGKKVLLYLGRIHPKKGISNLLKAWSKVCNGGKGKASDWSLVIAGWDQGRHESDLKAEAEAVGISGSVFFIGSQFNDAKVATYRNADAFVLPSFSEGLPMTILEAWAYGLPVIMTPQCNIPEGFATDAAIKVQPNPEEITGGLRNLIEMSDTERGTMGRNGLALVKKRFAWPIVAAEMKGFYKWVLGGGAPPECVSVKS